MSFKEHQHIRRESFNWFNNKCMHAKPLQSCLTLWVPMDHSNLPASSVIGEGLYVGLLNKDSSPAPRIDFYCVIY